jgi:hypothetical protein
MTSMDEKDCNIHQSKFMKMNKYKASVRITVFAATYMANRELSGLQEHGRTGCNKRSTGINMHNVQLVILIISHNLGRS